MLKKLIILILLSCLSYLMAFDNYSSAMGLHFGSSTGSGYSIRHWSSIGGIQGTLAAYTSDNDNPSFSYSPTEENPIVHGKRTILLGANYLIPLLEAKTYNFYIIAGGSYSFRSERLYTSRTQSSWKQRDRWTLGVGPGFEFSLSDRFHLSIEIPITMNYKDDLTMYIPAGGLYYYFK